MRFWREIDWQRPWLAPYRPDGQAVCRALEEGAAVAQALNERGTAPLRFIGAQALPAGEAYEAFIHRSGCVPTRDNLHDLFNGLVWMRFPRLKRHLNDMQAAEIRNDGILATRGPVRDALTLFDENAALWQAPPALADALRRRDWHGVFVAGRDAWRGSTTLLFGHALLEKLCRPRTPITAHAWWLPVGGDDLEALAVAALDRSRLAAKSHLPLPVLGVPGWWPANEAASFYADTSVFRPLASAPGRVLG